jgi:hypothetical protein
MPRAGFGANIRCSVRRARLKYSSAVHAQLTNGISALLRSDIATKSMVRTPADEFSTLLLLMPQCKASQASLLHKPCHLPRPAGQLLDKDGIPTWP